MKRLFVAVLTVMGGLGLYSQYAFSETILWDVRHSDGGYNYLDNHQSLINYLSPVFTVESADTGFVFDEANLSGYDVLVVSVFASEGSAYTSQEVTEISNFVSNGGGLLIMGDNSWASNANIQPVASAFGVTLSIGDVSAGSLVTSYLDADHLIFNESNLINQLHFQGPGRIGVSSPSEETAWSNEAMTIALVAAAEYGLGRVVTLGDASMMRDAFYTEQDNQEFSQNVFEYISGISTPEPATLLLLGLGAAVVLRGRKRA